MKDQKYYEKILIMLNETKEHLTFEYDGLLIDGYNVDVVKRFFDENPSDKFRIWLFNNNLILKEL